MMSHNINRRSLKGGAMSDPVAEPNGAVMTSDEDLAGLLACRFDCACGARHEIPTRAAIVERGALMRVGELLRALGLAGRALVVCDERTREAAGREIERALQSDGVPFRLFVVPGESPKADGETASLVASAAEPDDAYIISVGSGTVTDLSKWAAFGRDIPQRSVATAPSMNGYASGIAALTIDGLKCTKAVKPPLAVIADVDVLSRAPMPMIQAGLGDLVSKPVCGADWLISSRISGDRFCERPSAILREVRQRIASRAGALPARDPDAIAALAKGLILSGISMVIAGSSAPASGGEHLISHYIDMRADLENRRHDLHGAQVGVATLATARLYERLMGIGAAEIGDEVAGSSWDRGEKLAGRIKEIFGPRAAPILAEFQKKRGARDACVDAARRLCAQWEELKAAISPMLLPAAQIRAALDSAGAKVQYRDIGVGPDAFRDALELALCIRSRFTVLDIALAVGALSPWASENAGDAEKI